MSATATGQHSPEPDGDIAIKSTDDLVKAHGLARQRAEAGDLTGARTLMEDALAVGELRLGRNHPKLAPLMVDLATIARNLGNLTEARAQLRRAYAIVVAVAGPEHATSLSIEGRLAAINYRLGEATEAYDWHLADVGARVLGAEHPAVRGAQQRLASAPPPGDAEPGYAPTFEQPHSYAPADFPAPDVSPTDYEPAEVESQYQAYEPEAGYAPTSHPGVYLRRGGGDIHVIPAPPREPQEIDVWDEPQLPEPRYRRRGHAGGITLVVSLGIAVLVAAVVMAVQLFQPAENDPRPPGGGPDQTMTPTPQPSATDPPPTNVTIKDDGGSVTVTWTDPSDGRVPFIVTGAREGEAPKPLDSVPAGRTTSVIYGLNVRYDYCFTVSAVWAPEVIAPVFGHVHGVSPPVVRHRFHSVNRPPKMSGASRALPYLEAQQRLGGRRSEGLLG